MSLNRLYLVAPVVIAGNLFAQGQRPPLFKYNGVTYVSFTRGEYPVTASWRPESYIDTRAIRGAAVTSKRRWSGQGSLELDVDLIGGDAERSQGEVFVDIRYRPPICPGDQRPFILTSSDCTGRPGELGKAQDLTGALLTAYVYCPPGSAGWSDLPNGVRLYVKSVSREGDREVWSSFYGPYNNIREGEWNRVSVQLPGTGRNALPGSDATAGFDPEKASLVGLQIAAGRSPALVSRHAYFGKLWLDDLNWRTGDDLDRPGGCEPKYGFENIVDSIRRLKLAGANAVSIVVHWYMTALDSTIIAPDELKTHSDAELRDAIRRFRDEGFQVLLKPHVDLYTDQWRGLIRPRDEDVVQWFRSYERFILHYARIAAEQNVDLFAIGTELNEMVGPEFDGPWRDIIRAVKQVTGNIRLTYAANWDAYRTDRVPFWDELAVVGIDAYFPLSNEPQPTLRDLKNGWLSYCFPGPPLKDLGCRSWLQDLRNFHAEVQKPIIFTEIGFRSIRCCAREPASFTRKGDVNDDREVNAEDLELLSAVLEKAQCCVPSLTGADIDEDCDVDLADLDLLKKCAPTGDCGALLPEMKIQADAYKATYETLRQEPWFEGLFWWNWYPYSDAGGPCDTDFTPQGKPAEQQLAQ